MAGLLVKLDVFNTWKVYISTLWNSSISRGQSLSLVSEFTNYKDLMFLSCLPSLKQFLV